MKLEQKSVKNLVGFLGDLKTPKFHSKINWSLGMNYYCVNFLGRLGTVAMDFS